MGFWANPSARLVNVSWPGAVVQLSRVASVVTYHGEIEGLCNFYAVPTGAAGKYSKVLRGIDTGAADADFRNTPAATTGQNPLATAPKTGQRTWNPSPYVQGPFYDAAGNVIGPSGRPAVGMKPLTTFWPLAVPARWRYLGAFDTTYEELYFSGSLPSGADTLYVTARRTQWATPDETHTQGFTWTGATGDLLAAASGLAGVISSGSAWLTATAVASFGNAATLRIGVKDYTQPAYARTWGATGSSVAAGGAYTGTVITAAPTVGYDLGPGTFGAAGEDGKFTAT